MSLVQTGARTLDEAIRLNGFVLEHGTVNGSLIDFSYCKGSTKLSVHIDVVTDSQIETHLLSRIGLSRNNKLIVADIHSLSNESFVEVAGNFLTDIILDVYNKYQWHLADTAVYSDVNPLFYPPPSYTYAAGSHIH